MYPRRPAAGSQSRTKKNTSASQLRTKPLKRPVQARAKFTVNAIYDAFIKLWRSQGWEGISTRAVALETGISVGTLYEYFPNKQSLLSGYVRHCIDALLEAIDHQAILPSGLSWNERVGRLVKLTCGASGADLPHFDAEMLKLEYQIAEPKHHRRVYEEMLAKWTQVVESCTDLPCRPSASMVKTLFLSVWGGRRYFLLVNPQDLTLEQWVAETERLCCAALSIDGMEPAAR